jgi:ATP-dependent DNA ligase
MRSQLISKDSKGKIRVAIVESLFNDVHNCFEILRYTGQFNGKMTAGPVIEIYKGKAKRTLTEQMQLQFDALCKGYRDKGYKDVPNTKDVLAYSEAELEALLPENKTGSDGVLKPMLAKSSKGISKKTFDKQYYASRKINGVRALIYKKDGKIQTASRGSISYNLAIYYIIHNPVLETFFENHPDAILDGEIYKKGWTLNKISGICRSQSTVDDGKDLEFYWYDIVDLEHPFKDRLMTMYHWAEELKLSDFNPNRVYEEEDLQIQFVPHIKVSGWNNMKSLHDLFVQDGWEGLVIREENSLYRPGVRDNSWIKIKEYQDAEYPIVGLAEGLRDEDMCFILQTPSGQTFKCKPMGDRAQKQWYREHIEELKGKMLTIKYFEMSGVEGSDCPQQPVGVAIRDYE